MRGITSSICLLLVFGLAKGKPQYGPPAPDTLSGCPAYTHDCVPYYQCIDGDINTSGAGLIDVRIKPQKECINPEYPDVPGLCCRIPGATVPPPPPTPAPLQTCKGGLVCVEQGQCRPDGTVNTDGSGLIDTRIYSSCYVDTVHHVVGVCCQPPRPPPTPPPTPAPLTVCPTTQECVDEGACALQGGLPATYPYSKCYIEGGNYGIGVCCNPPIQVIDYCPSGSTCVPESVCQGDMLDSNNNFSPYGSGAIWQHCSGAANGPGVCCQNPYDPLVAAPTCGVRNSPLDLRIQTAIQKNEASFGEFPWQAIIFFRNFTYKCGASLVYDKWLVTGAHCVAGYKYGDFKIRLGEWQVDKYDEPLPYIDVDIASITIHPQFNKHNLHNDVALIELVTPVQLQYHINTVCLPPPGYLPAPGTRCFASGWGKDAFQGQYQAILKKVDVPFVDHYYCQELLRKTRLGKYFLLDQSLLCAGGEENKDACTGDGGGPLVCEDPATGQYLLQGIVAWGINCGQKDVPGVYADVQYFRDWIDTIILGTHAPVSNPY
ncbi:hypothetical protein SK128_022304 [Halocaridina rubra]|uniref:Peptidase S1 domain-containing protein n=1 Tax=Halocaridina rubra TaxID=373956 RepID=A0AAN8WAH0_HALRR